jgi:hypothetical protein
MSEASPASPPTGDPSGAALAVQSPSGAIPTMVDPSGQALTLPAPEAPARAATATAMPTAQRAEPGTPAMGNTLINDRLALEIGHAVLSVLIRANNEGRLPGELAQLSLSLPDHDSPFPGMSIAGGSAALELKPGAPPPAASAPRKRGPGTVTIRAAMRRAQELAVAPSGSDLGNLRLTLLAVVFAVALVAGAVVYVLRG